VSDVSVTMGPGRAVTAHHGIGSGWWGPRGPPGRPATLTEAAGLARAASASGPPARGTACGPGPRRPGRSDRVGLA
jgi:hypothetical protein